MCPVVDVARVGPICVTFDPLSEITDISGYLDLQAIGQSACCVLAACSIVMLRESSCAPTEVCVPQQVRCIRCTSAHIHIAYSGTLCVCVCLCELLLSRVSLQRRACDIIGKQPQVAQQTMYLCLPHGKTQNHQSQSLWFSLAAAPVWSNSSHDPERLPSHQQTWKCLRTPAERLVSSWKGPFCTSMFVGGRVNFYFLALCGNRGFACRFQ